LKEKKKLSPHRGARRISSSRKEKEPHTWLATTSGGGEGGEKKGQKGEKKNQIWPLERKKGKSQLTAAHIDVRKEDGNQRRGPGGEKTSNLGRPSRTPKENTAPIFPTVQKEAKHGKRKQTIL